MKLILWDIDGTLVDTDRAGERALLKALKETAGIDGSLNDIDYRGRTDAFIAREIFKFYKIPFSDEALNAFMERYLRNLAAELSATTLGKTHPGIVGLLEAIKARPDLAQGLLTGNLKRGAELKLSHFDVWRYFEFGAFANDSHLRNDLGPHALRRARDHHGHEFKVEEVFVVGDTPHDIECAKVIGANSIAVATGHFTSAQLAPFEPTALLEDLSDAAAFFAVIDGNQLPK